MICIIPARKNSKELKNKNILKINKKPLIDYTVFAAKKSAKIKKIYISTDDEKIINYYKKDPKVQIPFKRPGFLSTDKASSLDVYMHMIKHLEKKKINIRDFCVLLPTCQVRNHQHMHEATNINKQKKLTSLISVVKTDPLEWHFNINKKNLMKRINNLTFSINNRQDLKSVYRPNGSIYIFNSFQFKKNKNFMNNLTYCYEMNKKYSLDIDSKADYEIAKKLLTK